MLMVRLISLVFSLLVSVTAWSLDLREGDVFQGKIHLGKNPGRACFVKVQKDIVKGPEHSYHLIVYKNNVLAGRSFNARNYGDTMTAIGSSYLTKDSAGKLVPAKNDQETLHVQLQNQTLSRAAIYHQQKAIVNCIQLRRLP